MCQRLLLTVCLLAACGTDSPSSNPGPADFPKLEDGCQPLLGGVHCLLPYPSDFFSVANEAMPSGRQVVVRGAARTVTLGGMDAEFTDFHDLDGFSRIPLIVGLLDDSVVADGFVDILGDASKSQITSSQSLLIDTVTGELVAHFTDIDPRPSNSYRRAIALHPLSDLEEKRRYVVVIQGVMNEEGTLAKTASGFDLLRDERTDGVAAFDGVREHFEDEVFPVLEQAGVDRQAVQLAWDFTTGSDAHLMRDILSMRAMTQEWMSNNAADLAISSVQENPEDKPAVWKRIHGTIHVPLFLESAETGAMLSRDSEGNVQQNGTAEVEFQVNVPLSVRDAGKSAGALFYGHGFFGGRNELDGELTQVIASELEVVMIAIDWWGMSAPDIVPLINDLSGDPVHTLRFADRVHQAMCNWIVMTQSLSILSEQVELTRPASGPGSGEGTLAGQALIDTSKGISFMGVSQGHILGGMLAAVLPKLDRIVLHAGGAGLSHFMFRAEAFSALLELISRHFKDPIEQYAWAATTQRIFDRIDPGMYARHVLREPFEGATPRQVLMQMGVGDIAVPNFGSYLHARAIGLPAVSNEELNLHGMPDQQSSQSGFSSYDYGVDTDFYRQAVVPLESNDVHNKVRVEASALEQISRFLEVDGQVEATCDGACDPN